MDINGNGSPDLVIPTANRGLVALDGRRGWEIWNTGEMIEGRLNAAPLMGDLNGDGLINFVAASENGHVVAFTTQGGKVWRLWETQLPKLHYASPALIRVDKRNLVVVATDGHGVVALDGESGRPVWNVGMGKRFFASPVAADANGNRSEDVVVVAENGDIHALDGRTGDEIWSLALGVGVQASPALFDLTQDGLMDLIILDGRGTLHCVNMERGRVTLTLPVTGADGFLASPLLADVNGDGLVNIVTAAKNGQVSVLFLNRGVGRNPQPWPVFLGR